MFVVKAKIYGVPYNHSNPISFVETLVIGQHQKAPNFSAFQWSPYCRSALPNHEGSTFTEKDRNKLNYRIEPKRIESDQAVRAVHGCNSLLFLIILLYLVLHYANL